MKQPLNSAYRIASRVPWLKRVVPGWMRRGLYDVVLETEIPRYPDRVHMRDAIVPFIASRNATQVLNVGTRRYSRDTIDLLSITGAEVWTIDIDPLAARWGSPGRHVVGDAMVLDRVFQGDAFDCVVMNGVLGFGIDSREQIDRTFLGLSRVIRPAGLLVIGWNRDRIDDPTTYALQEFEKLPGHDRVGFAGSTHSYELYEKR